jgi:hypothetical protein
MARQTEIASVLLPLAVVVIVFLLLYRSLTSPEFSRALDQAGSAGADDLTHVTGGIAEGDYPPAGIAPGPPSTLAPIDLTGQAGDLRAYPYLPPAPSSLPDVVPISSWPFEFATLGLSDNFF